MLADLYPSLTVPSNRAPLSDPPQAAAIPLLRFRACGEGFKGLYMLWMVAGSCRERGGGVEIERTGEGWRGLLGLVDDSWLYGALGNEESVVEGSKGCGGVYRIATDGSSGLQRVVAEGDRGSYSVSTCAGAGKNSGGKKCVWTTFGASAKKKFEVFPPILRIAMPPYYQLVAP